MKHTQRDKLLWILGLESEHGHDDGVLEGTGRADDKGAFMERARNPLFFLLTF